MNSNYQEIIDDIVWAIEGGENEFSLTFVRCNYPKIYQEIILGIQNNCDVVISQLILDKTTCNIYEAIDNFAKSEDVKSLIILGINEVSNIDNLLLAANLQRERFRENFKFPIIIWMNDAVFEKFKNLIKDFQTWAGIALNIDVNLEDLKENLQEKIEFLFEKIIEVGSAEFISNESILEINYQVELDSVVKDIERLGENLNPELEGSLEFIKGRSLYQENKFNDALESYENCLNIWQKFTNISSLKKAVLYFNIGLTRYGLSEKENQKCNLEKAQAHLENCLHIFEEEKRDDLVGKFINCLGKILRELKQWEKLKVLANKALSLNKNNHLFLAEVYGFLTEICLSESNYKEALNCINLVQDTLKKGDFDSYQLPIYLLLLALVQENLRNHQEAIKSEEKAIEIDVNQEERYYFLELLERLSNLYFKNQEYLASFKTKLNLKSFKQQYALIAFVGAGRIKASKDNITNLSQEIANSGRQYDVDNLIERIFNINNKVTIIYGQSGVGKSSILEAGLIPVLQQKKYIKNNEILTANLRVYNNWQKELGELLLLRSRSTTMRSHHPSSQTRSPLTPLKKVGNMTTEFLIEVLKEYDQNNITTILFFDQFEEFFFVTKSQKEINEFFSFVAECLKIVYVKIVFSLREDYIYLLLQGTRNLNLEAINDNILDKNILYYLGNLSTNVTKDLITNLTQRCNLNLEAKLIEQLVTDLTTDLEEIRPIELQIIGSQIQTEKITSLAQYNNYGISSEIRKEALVNNYLADVIKSCGEENEELAKLILSLLINEKDNTRPLKTRLEIEEALEKKDKGQRAKDKGNFESRDVPWNVSTLTSKFWSLRGEKQNNKSYTSTNSNPEAILSNSLQRESNLDLILNIFVLSGLVMLIPEKPFNHYQLVHDYLVEVIQKQGWNSLSTKLKKAEAERDKEAKAKLRFFNWLKVAVVILSIVSGVAVKYSIDSWRNAKQADQETIKAKNQEIIALSQSSKAYHALNSSSFNPLIEALKAGINIQENPNDIKLENKRLATLMLHQSIYDGLREKNRLKDHQSYVASVAFSPNGETIASASSDQTVKLWSKSGQLLKTLEDHQERVNSVVFSPDGEIIASASGDIVKLWSKSGQLLTTLEDHQNIVNSVAFSSDGEIIASASGDIVKLWSQSGQLLTTLQGHQSIINSIVFSPNEEIIASASNDQTVKLWSQSGQLLTTLEDHQNYISSVAFSPDGETIASASWDGKVKLWSKSGQLLQTLKGHQDVITSIAFSPDGETIASGSWDDTVKLWSKSGQLLQTLKGHQDIINSIVFSPDGETIASGSSDQTVKLWSKSGQIVDILEGHQDSVNSIVFSKDGEMIASGSGDQTVKLWNKSGQLLTTLQGHQNIIYSVVFSKDGEMIASASGDQTVKLWNKSGQLLTTLQGHQDGVNSVAFSPNGEMITSASANGIVKFWSKSGQLLTTLEAHQNGVNDIVFSPDGEMIASASWDGTVKLWHKSLQLMSVLQGHKHIVNSVIFSPDGEMIASASWDGTVKLWHKSGQPITTFEGHNNIIYNVVFSPDGETIASVGDNKIKLWSKSGKLLHTFEDYQYSVNSVIFSPDGNTIASSSGNNIKLWNLDLDNLVKEGCNWIKDYLKYSAEVNESDRKLCNDINP